ncbi:hypothetical protein IRZ71_17740 [Flavobacterium sp. ANB]|uniref:hypothetical protein n=1 Tax=unclassified Flavobacterium TaxID=196869 RepID=UPI0012B95EF5|nr:MULTISPECIES: hypothetical protein [unclassified Flavobacterium]MBF4518210.1 hypothetical protein [Flavobacterium sp. ANB]MTD71092.1 hypothetical protein [Flavobacterium sp. LC2016-13]
MKEYIDTINWQEVWEFSKHIILPNLGWFIFWTILFILLGLIISIVLNVYLYRKNFFTRDRTYYNWIAKLWIPYIIIVCIYFFGMLGLFYGGHSILSKENKSITANIYTKTVGSTFSSEKDKKAFLQTLQQLSNSSEDVSKSLTKTLGLYIEKNNTGLSSVDNFKNSSSTYLLKKYESEVYAATMYGFMKVIDDKADIASFKKIKYTELKSLLTKLDKIEPKRIEESIQLEMGHKLQAILDYIYKGIMKHELLFFVLFLIIPFIEYFIYWKFLKKKVVPVVNETSANQKNNEVYSKKDTII